MTFHTTFESFTSGYSSYKQRNGAYNYIVDEMTSDTGDIMHGPGIDFSEFGQGHHEESSKLISVFDSGVVEIAFTVKFDITYGQMHNPAEPNLGMESDSVDIQEIEIESVTVDDVDETDVLSGAAETLVKNVLEKELR